MELIQAITGRRSVRAFMDTPVSRQSIHTILDTARWAPSGANIQPWQVSVLGPKSIQVIGDRIVAACEAGQAENPDYAYYPTIWNEPYRSRRNQCGAALYEAMNVKREDKEARKALWYRNYYFFDAPVGLAFFIDRQLSQGSWLDMGMFIQNVMLAAREYGLETCPQASLVDYPDIIRDVLGRDDNQLLLCAMALGYPDTRHPINRYQLDRLSVDEFTQWHD